MIQQHNPYFQVIADIISSLIGVFQPIISPIGNFMIAGIEVILPFFPYGALWVYAVIFGVLVISGIVINWIWSGDQPIGYKPAIFTKLKEKTTELKEKTVGRLKKGEDKPEEEAEEVTETAEDITEED